jgi:MFS transporter, PCFT/HCP family, solute carrier family 46, member 3
MSVELQQSTLQVAEETVEKSKNACLEFFDPRLANQCIQSLFKKRDYGVRTILILLMAMHFLTHGVVQGEGQNIFLYQRVKLGWDIATNTYHNVFNIVMGLIGTLLMAGLLSKYLKVSDIGLTLISTALTFVSRVIYSIVTSTTNFFIGSAVDFCSSVKFLGARAAVSKLVPSEDLSTMFAVMGLCEALAALIFAYIYPTVYQILLDDKTRDVSEMFHLSAGLLLIGFIVYS